MNTGKCHKCEALLVNVMVEAMSITEGFTPAWNGASFVCPFCRAILGVGLDPLALKTDIVNEILEALGKH